MAIRYLYLSIFIFFASCSTNSENSSLFKDKKLEAAVRKVISKNDSQEITREDLSQIVELNCVGCISLDGIKNLRNLQKLVLSRSTISDFSMLKELVQFNSLTIIYSKFPNIEFISDLPKLNYLYLDKNKTNINTAVFKKTPNLEYLYILNEKISDISSMRNLSKLKVLNVNNNKINDISIVTNLKKIEEIEANGNYIKNLPDFSGCKSLKKIDLSYNKLIYNPNFYHLKHIRELILVHNEINNINWITSLDSIEYLNLILNPINCDDDAYRNDKIEALIDSDILHLDCK